MSGGEASRAVSGPPRSIEPPRVEAVIRACLEEFPHLRLRVTGACMSPRLLPGDTVLLADARRRPPRIGDVVLVLLPVGLRLHRLVWGPPLALWGRWRTAGDAAGLPDPPLGPDAVLGTAVGIEGTGPRPSVSSFPRGLRSLCAHVVRRFREALPRASRA
jgi:hypothetical protein